MKKILFILFCCIIPVIVFSGEADDKIGPLLHEKINPSERKHNTMNLQQADPYDQPIDDPGSTELIKVIVVMNRHHLSDLSQSIVAQLETKVNDLGGHIGDHALNRVQVFIPPEKIKDLATWGEIKIIKHPTTPETSGNNVGSEGVSIGNIDNWQRNGITGKNVRVGVLDVGFLGYNSLIGSELPINTTAVYTGTNADFYSTGHGTACAEIVHDVAPDADLYLINVADLDVDYISAVNWLEQKNVDIISSSIGLNLRTFCYYIHNLLYSSHFNQAYAATQLEELSEIQESISFKVDQTVSGGITWVQAAGNSAQSRWKGNFYDPDRNGFHNFSGNDEFNEITFLTYGEPIYIVLAWAAENDFVTADDYDLYLYNESTGRVVSSSIQDQNVTGLGFESCEITPHPYYRYSIAIKKYSGSNQELTIMIGYENIANLEYNSPGKTINNGTPNADEKVISVGAVPYYNPYVIEDFSSQGPGENGIIKPDLVAPDAVSTVSYERPFYGTSAAAPHVAGISALIKQRYPSYSPQQMKHYLESNALDLGAPGKDNVYGSGLVQLPDIINCIYSISPSSGSFTSSGGYASVSVSASHASCSWTASESLSWVDLSLSGGTGTRTVTVSVTANAGAARSGSVTIAGRTYAIYQAETGLVREFVSRFYRVVLGREPEDAGLAYWVYSLENGTRAGADVARGFVFSNEFMNKRLGDEAFVRVLYAAFFNREPDQGGRNHWLASLYGGTSRENLLNNFIYSQEFADLCQQYSIVPVN